MAKPKFDLEASADFFARLKQGPFLLRVGEELDDDSVPRVSDWEAADKALAGLPAINARIGGVNYKFNRLYVTFGQSWLTNHYDQMLEQVQKMRPTLVRTRIGKIRKQHGLRESCAREVVGDLTGIALEYACHDAFTDGGFSRRHLEEWYLRGHLPCGWKGKLPKQPKMLDRRVPIEQLHVPLLEDHVGTGRVIVF